MVQIERPGIRSFLELVSKSGKHHSCMRKVAKRVEPTHVIQDIGLDRADDSRAVHADRHGAPKAQSTRVLCKRFNVTPTKIIRSEYYTWTDIDPNVKNTILAGPMGKNKTGCAVDFLLNLPKSLRGRILWLTPSITLTENTLQRLRDARFDVASYRNFNAHEKRNGALESKAFTLDSVQSLHYLKRTYDFVIIDEIEKMFGGNAKTHPDEDDPKKDRLLQNWDKLKSVIHGAKKVIAMDAFTTQTTIEFFNNIKKDNCVVSNARAHTEILDISTPPSPRFFKEYNTKYDLITTMCESIERGNKIFVFTPFPQGEDNPHSVTQLSAFLCGKFGWTIGKEILIYWSKTVNEKKKLANCEPVWNNPEVRCILTNSCITVGVNFNIKDAFNEIYCFYHSLVGARDFIQALYRVRHPTSNVMHIYREKGIIRDVFRGGLTFPES